MYSIRPHCLLHVPYRNRDDRQSVDRIADSGLTAFLPQLTFRGMNISNDALVTMTCAAAVYLIIRLMKRGFDQKLGLITTAVFSAAFLSKINALFLPVPFALALLSAGGRSG